MIPRYTLPEMEKIWSEENRFNRMFEIELAVCEALSKTGIMPEVDYKKIKQKAKLDIERVREIEKVTKHDIAAFVDQISENLGDESRWIHFGLTSSDVLDTATAIQLRDSSDLILKKLKTLSDELKKLAVKHKNTMMIGRTHGMHAEPITFGVKVLGWYAETERLIALIESTRETVSYGKLSGTVGTYTQNDPEIEKIVCNKLGLKPEPVSTQIIPRDRYAVYILRLALVAGAIERFAVEIRNLQRTEISEVEEFFSKGQKGSSAMPHKRNPILSENICGLARLVKANSMVSLENMALWHERDISHSSAERVVLPDSSIVIDFILTRFANIVKNLVVYPENMKANLEKSYGAYFSQNVLLRLIKKGLKRDTAYKIVQKISHTSLQEKKDFGTIAKNDMELKEHLSAQEIQECTNLKSYTRNIDKIFKSVLKE
ncbi:MAG: adenylosuccinate lyase [Elusimicrobia bacterium CG1_02_37_114]|nr:MAG: adenylosuccinate lyase [Elusimicrobia bacterium CG1_02_37_114]PIV52597.1 MAG: adenylosuccinate lyase [Elusimicrobia bacterium CG02_land_8_20_14_3_00_37_13]PIZ13302.1 MAG: adenylosuccinate lyase [Elusimicrobia bacterium CG_4_10_14_0_8_um_filter_37_32]